MVEKMKNGPQAWTFKAKRGMYRAPPESGIKK
jgi:hypothetical protein